MFGCSDNIFKGDVGANISCQTTHNLPASLIYCWTKKSRKNNYSLLKDLWLLSTINHGFNINAPRLDLTTREELKKD
jgi:hypothetical protein